MSVQVASRAVLVLGGSGVSAPWGDLGVAVWDAGIEGVDDAGVPQ